jgi:hypothetical protein
MKLQEVFLGSIWINLFISGFILFTQCTSIDTDSKNFDEFLHQFETTIAEEEHYYIILSKYACQSCIQYYTEVLSEYNSMLPKNTVTFILSNDRTYSTLQKNSFHFIRDKNGTIERLSLNITGFAVLKTKNGRIVQQWNFSSSDENEYRAFLEQEFGENP